MIESLKCLAFWTPGPFEIVAILVVCVLLFGKRLPEIARGMGRTLIEFKKGLKDTKEDIEKSIDNETKKEEDQKKETDQ